MTNSRRPFQNGFAAGFTRDSANRFRRAFAAYFFLVISMTLAIPPLASAQEKELPVKVNPGQLKPAMIFWRVGINDPEGELAMVETFYPSTYNGKAVWRGIHRANDPTIKDFDLHMDDVDATTLRPVRSVFRFDEGYVNRSYDGNKVKLESRSGEKTSSSEHTLSTGVMPANGPASGLFLAALPLRKGYSATYHVLSHQKQTADPMKLSVVGRETIRIAAGEYDTFVVVTSPAGGEPGEITKHWVLASPPHYTIRTEWKPKPGEIKLSEVTRLLVG